MLLLSLGVGLSLPLLLALTLPAPRRGWARVGILLAGLGGQLLRWQLNYGQVNWLPVVGWGLAASLLAWLAFLAWPRR